MSDEISKRRKDKVMAEMAAAQTSSGRQDPRNKTAAGAAMDLSMFEMTAEAAEEHEWWIYWLSFVGASLLGVLLLAGTFCRVAVSPALANSALPLAGFASFVITMILCCRVHSRHNRFQPGVVIPVISELGIQQPGTLVYQVGFVLVGLLLAGSMYCYETTVVPLLLGKDCSPSSAEEEKLAGISRAKFTADLSTAVQAGYASAFGAGLQGFYTLDVQASLKVMLHFVGAMIFMWGGMTHAQTIEPIYAAAARGSLECNFLSQTPVGMAAAFRRMSITGALPVVGFLLPLGFQVAQYVYGGSDNEKSDTPGKAMPNHQQPTNRHQEESSDDAPEHMEGEVHAKKANGPGAESAGMNNAMGAMQWAIVILFASFYASYAPDLYYAAPPLDPASDDASAVHPVVALLCLLIGLATGLAFYYTEYMMD